jgi:hypothetical protein
MILDAPSSRPHSFNLFWRLLDIRPDSAFSVNGNSPGAQVSMQYHSLLSDFVVFPDLAHISSRGISACPSAPSLSFWRARVLDPNIGFRQFQRSSFWPHEITVHFSHWPVFKARNFFLPGAFDIM